MLWDSVFAIQEEKMRLLGAVLLGGVFLIGGPAVAQERNNNTSEKRDNMSRSDEQRPLNEAQNSMRREATHHSVHRRVTYQRNYKTDDEERQQTERLNQQYRGGNGSDTNGAAARPPGSDATSSR